MKLSKLQTWLDAYAAVLKSAGALPAANAIGDCAAFLALHKSKNVSDIIAKGGAVASCAAAADSSPQLLLSTRQTAKLLEDLSNLMKAMGPASAKAAADRNSIIDFAKLLRLAPESELTSATLEKLRVAMIPASTEPQVASYIERLKRTARTPDFRTTIDEIGRSKLSKQDVLAIAREIFGDLPNSTPRSTALKKMYQLDDAYQSAKRGIDATGGRSAA